MNVNILKQYENVKFTEEQLPLFANLLEIVKKTGQSNYIKVYDVFHLIGKSTKYGNGITKKEIQEQLNISRKICDDIISLLQGASLIQYDDTAREQPWTLAIRGFQLGKYYKEKVKGDNQ